MPTIYDIRLHDSSISDFIRSYTDRMHEQQCQRIEQEIFVAIKSGSQLSELCITDNGSDPPFVQKKSDIKWRK